MDEHAALSRYDTTTVSLDMSHQRICITKITDLDTLLESIDPVTFAEDDRIPYWAELWPSAVGLARYVSRLSSLDGQQTLELGCGLGLVGVAAALQGARVLCTDYEADALRFARYNAHVNRCQHMRFRLVDWFQPALRRRYEVILASDVIYEARNFGPLVAVLQRYLARGGYAVFADPGRANAVPFFTLLRHRGFTYQKRIEPVEWDGAHRIEIYTIRHRRERPTLRRG